MINGLSGFNPLIRIHLKHFDHDVDFDIVHYWSVPGLNSLRMGYLWKLKALISAIPIKFILQEVWEWPQDLLDDEQLIHFAVTREEGLTVHELTHNAAYSPDINFFAVR